MYVSGFEADPLFVDCRFIDNVAQNGGAVKLMDWVKGRFVRCEFIGNTVTTGVGAAVQLINSHYNRFDFCTFTGNTSQTACVFHLVWGTVNLSHSIVAFNSGSYPVVSTGDSQVQVSYTDIYGNDAGDWVGLLAEAQDSPGNFTADPKFMGEFSGDVRLQADSPCIDAGNPSLPPDPDGTLRDLGARYRHQDPPPVAISLLPVDAPIVIPADGGAAVFQALLINSTGGPATVDAWTEITLPDGSTFGPLLQQTVTLPAGGIVAGPFSQAVPGWAPPGVYTYTAYVGEYPGTVVDQGALEFEKLGVVGEVGSPSTSGSRWPVTIRPR